MNSEEEQLYGFCIVYILQSITLRNQNQIDYQVPSVRSKHKQTNS